MPSVSVIIPTYNRAGLLGHSISSVLNQTYTDLEIIIVDDGSTDDTESIVHNLGSKKIRYIKHEHNRGAAAARNTGIKASTGAYLAFQDSDDEWLPTKLEKQIGAFEKNSPQLGLVYCASIIARGNKTIFVPCFENGTRNGNFFSNLVKFHFITTQLMVIRRECLDKIGVFDETLPLFDEWDLCLRIGRQYQYKGIEEPLVIRHMQKDSISDDLDRVVTGYRSLINKHLDDIKNDKKLLAGCYLKLGHMLLLQGNRPEGRDYLAKSFKLYPWDLRTGGCLGLSSLGHNSYKNFTRIYRGARSLFKTE